VYFTDESWAARIQNLQNANVHEQGDEHTKHLGCFDFEHSSNRIPVLAPGLAETIYLCIMLWHVCRLDTSSTVTSVSPAQYQEAEGSSLQGKIVVLGPKLTSGLELTRCSHT